MKSNMKRQGLIGLIDSFGEEGMQLVQPSKLLDTRSRGGIGTHACELGLCCYFSHAKNFQCLYSYYGELHAMMPSSPKEYIILLM